jgi:hypothetical protein
MAIARPELSGCGNGPRAKPREWHHNEAGFW